jgi:FtsP/CotA-like multicopper oxidase with cupredoxin domain
MTSPRASAPGRIIQRKLADPYEIAEIAVRFTTYSGRYMYHCHILEHEDRDMMRPFVTMPAELMPFMA